MGPTMSTGRGEAFVDERVPAPSGDAGRPEALADFLESVRGMVQQDRPTRPVTQPSAQHRADKSLRRHEDKLAKAERRSARKRRKRARTSPDAVPVREHAGPSEVQRIPAQATGAEDDEVAGLDVTAAVAQGEASLSGRARRRDRQRAAALVAAGATEDDPELVLTDGSPSTVVGSKRRSRSARRLERRRDAARAVAQAVPLDESGGRRPDGGDDSAATYPGAAETARPGLGRALKVGAVVIVIAAAIAVPWAEPRVPDAISGILPGGGDHAVKDPVVAPPTAAVVGPVGVERQGGPYAGVRLQAAGRPRQVVVPRLQVDSQVVPISGQSGSLLPPSDPQILGWWQEGRPVGSQHGSAVITGHTVHTGGGALDHLGELVVGDSVRVRTDAGWIRYVVQQTRIYSTAELARDAENVFRLGGTGRLVLITCDDWNGQSYDSNAVVVAAPVLDQPNGS
jgi:LPXTG-site transpeptidase (sortase) family protein